jgi:hypothetical protein
MGGRAVTPFLVTGLPRSRTAWLANLLTTGTTLCYHDAIRFGDPVELLMAPIDGVGARGIADSALCCYHDAIFACWPDAPLVIVRRPFEECVSSFAWAARELVAESDARRALVVLQRELAGLSKRPHLEVPYESLSHEAGCRRVWENCQPRERWSGARWRELDRIRMEMKMPTRGEIANVLRALSVVEV